MAEQQNTIPYTEEERNDLTAKSKAMLNAALEKGNLKKVLETMGRNGKFTLNNTLLILAQKPNATVAKNVQDWNAIGRTVKEGEYSMEIMKPIKEKTLTPILENGREKLDENGEVMMKSREETKGFQPSYVFDISQTQGEEYAPFKISKEITDDEKHTVMRGVRRALQNRRYKIAFVDENKLPEGKRSATNRKERTVQIKKGMDNYATVLTVLHESGKALTGSMKYGDFGGFQGEEAYMLESACADCILASHFGMNTEKYDFSYTTAWNDEEKEKFYQTAKVVCRGVGSIMENVDNAFAYAAQSGSEGAGAGAAAEPSLSLFRGKQQTSEMVAS